MAYDSWLVHVCEVWSEPIAEYGSTGYRCQSCSWQLNKENEYSPVKACRVCLFFSILGLNLVLTCGIPPEFRGGVHLFI